MTWWQSLLMLFGLLWAARVDLLEGLAAAPAPPPQGVSWRFVTAVAALTAVAIVNQALVILGIVPPHCDERFAVMVDSAGMADSRWVRAVEGRQAIVAAAVAEVGGGDAGPLGDDFHALGLAWLLSELLARRMRSSMALGATNFEEATVAAARRYAPTRNGLSPWACSRAAISRRDSARSWLSASV